LSNHQLVGRSAAAISSISGAISGSIEAKRQKIPDASSAHAKAVIAEAEVHAKQFDAYESVSKSVSKEDRGELDGAMVRNLLHG
jgi:hypothetical protein